MNSYTVWQNFLCYYISFIIKECYVLIMTASSETISGEATAV